MKSPLKVFVAGAILTLATGVALAAPVSNSSESVPDNEVSVPDQDQQNPNPTTQQQSSALQSTRYESEQKATQSENQASGNTNPTPGEYQAPNEAPFADAGTTSRYTRYESDANSYPPDLGPEVSGTLFLRAIIGPRANRLRME